MFLEAAGAQRTADVSLPPALGAAGGQNAPPTAQAQRRREEAEQKKLYEKLIQTAEQMVRQSRRVEAVLGEPTEPRAKQLLASMRAYAAVGRAGDHPDTYASVAGQEGGLRPRSVLSMFEPHTCAIPLPKGGALVEFGRQVMLYARGRWHRDAL